MIKIAITWGNNCRCISLFWNFCYVSSEVLVTGMDEIGYEFYNIEYHYFTIGKKKIRNSLYLPTTTYIYQLSFLPLSTYNYLPYNYSIPIGQNGGSQWLKKSNNKVFLIFPLQTSMKAIRKV